MLHIGSKSGGYKKDLSKDVWSKDSYYKTAGEGSMEFDHPAMKKLLELSNNAKTILDMGCGEGTRLSKLVGQGQKGMGIDISEKAIFLAKKKYPNLDFRVGDLEKLPFSENEFDLVYSAFVFEHLDNPEKVLKEGIRVLKKGGRLLIAAPNFGAPNRASPPFKGNRFLKLILGFAMDFLPGKRVSWNKVQPIADVDKYEIDWDATAEPYICSLIRYLKQIKMRVLYTSSLWEMEDKSAGIFQKIFGLLGRGGIYPFKYWGPHLLLIAEKTGN